MVVWSVTVKSKCLMIVVWSTSEIIQDKPEANSPVELGEVVAVSAVVSALSTPSGGEVTGAGLMFDSDGVVLLVETLCREEELAPGCTESSITAAAAEMRRKALLDCELQRSGWKESVSRVHATNPPKPCCLSHWACERRVWLVGGRRCRNECLLPLLLLMGLHLKYRSVLLSFLW